MIQLTDNVFALQIPKKANGFTIGKELNTLTYYIDKPSLESIRTKYLPVVGQWEFICTSKDATEEQAADIAEVCVHMENFEELVKDGWWNYESGLPFKTAIEGLQSLLKSKGLEGNYAMLRKI